MAESKRSTGSNGLVVPIDGGELQTRAATGVLRWRAPVVEAESVCTAILPRVLADLIGQQGCRVFCGTTEDLTGWVLRVYSEDRSLALFPRTVEEWEDIAAWSAGPTVLDDIRQQGEVVQSERGRRRR